MKHIHNGVKPLCIAALRLIELLELSLKQCENAARRIAGLEPVSEWVLKEIVLCALIVGFQGIVENELEVGRCGRRVIMRHHASGGKRGIERRTRGLWVVGKEKGDTPQERAGTAYDQ